MTAQVRSPLPWLGALLAIYLIAPVAAFVVRLAGGIPSAPGLGGALGTSLLAATISTAIVALLGVPLAYLLARARGPLAGVLSVLVALPLALPPLVGGILLLYLVGPYSLVGRLFGGELTDSLTGIVLAQTFVAAPFALVAARAAFAAVAPDLEDVARTLGHGRVARFAKVALPVARNGVQAGLLLAWLRAFGEFGATVILAYHPYSLPVYTFVQFDSTGIPGTLAPVAAALAAALVVLAAVQVRGRRGRSRARIPPAVAPRREPAGALAFSLRALAGDFELDVAHAAGGPHLALLGPSGAGKTLTLRVLAGIAEAERAEIHSGAATLGGLAAEQRRVGYLPQHSALFPRRTVWQQITFAVDAEEPLAAWWLKRLGLEGLQDRFPEELSGGQQRRVALARALARNPSLILLDEPFSALDAPVRAGLCRELRRLQREVGISSVLVTHDPEEAALLAEDILVLDGGRVLQRGTAAEVLARPASPRVAALLGIPNAHTATVLDGGRISTGGLEMTAPTGALAPGSEVNWAVRPEDIQLDARGAHRATVLDAVALGATHELTVRAAELELTIRTTRSPVPVGSECWIDLPAQAIALWPAEEHGPAGPNIVAPRSRPPPAGAPPPADRPVRSR